MDRYSFDSDAQFEMAMNRFATAVENAVGIKNFFDMEEDDDYDRCTCGMRASRAKHCPEHM